MIPQGGGPPSADERCSKPHNIPLLSQGNHQHRSHDQVGDLERADGEVTDGFSRQSSFEFIDRSFARHPSQPRTWTAILGRYAAWFGTSIRGWKRKSEDARRKRSGCLRAGLYLVAIILMILLVLLWSSSPSSSTHTDDVVSGAFCSLFHWHFLHLPPFFLIPRLISLTAGVIRASYPEIFIGQPTSPET